MLTPRFELSQTDSEVIIDVHAPYANIKDTEVYVEGTDFRFYSTPYYLRLKLPGEIVENDSSSGWYDCEKGIFFLKFSKVNVGRHFENLDMITTLLAPPKENKDFLAPKIQVISNPAANDDGESNEASNEAEEEDETDKGDAWFVPQTPAVDSATTSLLPNAPRYGFANKISGALASFDAAWIKEIIDLPMPDSMPMEDRKKLREIHEHEAFSEDHYMADLVSKECVEPYTTFTAAWETLKPEQVSLGDTDKDILKELPNKEYLLDNDEAQIVLFGLVDILFGSCYNHRITNGENTPESSWDINKLSSTLCWFQHFSSMDEVIRACVRRSLCYPMCRNWDLSMKVFEDVKQVVKLGKKYIVKRFCEIHELFNNSYEPRYLLNQLYIKDYLIWLQQAPVSVIESIVPMLDAVTPTKADMGFDLDELEVATWSVYGENLCFENAVNEIVNEMENATLEDHEKEMSNRHTNLQESKKYFNRWVLGNGSGAEDSSSDSESDSDSDSDSDNSSCTSTSSSSSDSSSSTSNTEKLDSDDLSDSGSAS